ncbi:hypothetical protein ACHQM5_007837 [Ranunculus cassubicifolius]
MGLQLEERVQRVVRNLSSRIGLLCECQSKMTIVKEFLSTVPQWTVKKFSNDHNHELLEDDQLPFLDRDVRNFIHSATKKTDRGKDAIELLNMCKDLKERNANFVYECTLDEDGKLENLEWTYVDSIHAYEAFGDIVVFDATFREVDYNRVLGVWFGVDNHGKIIFFGAALLQDESVGSFAWGLQTFHRLMKGRHPLTILSDLGFGIRDAIASELLHTKHVFCMWHVILQTSAFTRLYNIETVKDFERLWNQMVSCFGLQSNKHIALLSTHRASWALPYVKGFFHAGMTKFERSKMIDGYLEEILSVKTGTDNFFEKVGIITKFRYQTGEDEMEDAHIKTSMPMEEHASSILTPYAFNLLQQEITISMQCAAFAMPNGFWTPRDEKIQCGCKEFDFAGILCRHALRVLVLKNYFHIPEKYLLIRWRKESSLIFQMTRSDIVDWPHAFHSLSAALYAESVVSKERINYVQSELTKVLNHVKNMQGSDDAHISMEAAPAFNARIEDVGAESSANSSECMSVGYICQSNSSVYQSEVSIQT